MPFQATFSQLPCGVRYVRLETSGRFSKEDAEPLIQLMSPGGELHGLPILLLTEKLESVGSEARALFAGRGDAAKDPWIAAVVANPVVRVTLNFLKRVQKQNKGMMFANEPAALQWLDARAREDRGEGPGTR